MIVRGWLRVQIAAWLETFVAEQRALSGAVYERTAAADEPASPQTDDLTLVAAWNLAPAIVASAHRVHRGQGLAGLAFERNATLSTCTGRGAYSPALMGAFETRLPQQSSVALPVQDASGEVRALVYLVFPPQVRLRDDELIQILDRAAHALVPALASIPRRRKPAVGVRPGAARAAASTTGSLPVIA